MVGKDLAGESIRYIDLAYDPQNTESSIKSLIYSIRPQWRQYDSHLDIKRFDDGLTNDLFKITANGVEFPEPDQHAILLRAYGHGTELMFDRQIEAALHRYLAPINLAAQLFARFENGFLYAFVPGTACTASDLVKPEISASVACRLAELHARVPLTLISSIYPSTNTTVEGDNAASSRKEVGSIEALHPRPNFWLRLRDWVRMLPTATQREMEQRQRLEQEVDRSFMDLHRPGPGSTLVCAHCDLVPSNIIRLPISDNQESQDSRLVAFIDWEYSSLVSPAYDLANYFATFAGFECDYTKMPTSTYRRQFIRHYASAYQEFTAGIMERIDENALYEQVERYRGIPGLHAGVWALVQSSLSHIDFDYSKYADQRLSEYFEWRDAFESVGSQDNKQSSFREQMWARE